MQDLDDSRRLKAKCTETVFLLLSRILLRTVLSSFSSYQFWPNRQADFLAVGEEEENLSVWKRESFFQLREVVEGSGFPRAKAVVDFHPSLM